MSDEKPTSSMETRDQSRDSMFLLADLAVAGGGPAEKVKVRNLSSGGMMVESDLRPGRGSRIAVELRNIGAVGGTVMWVRGSRFGVAFDEEIDPRMARTQVSSGPKEAPVYARAAIDAPRYDGWNGKMRRI